MIHQIRRFIYLHRLGYQNFYRRLYRRVTTVGILFLLLLASIDYYRPSWLPLPKFLEHFGILQRADSEAYIAFIVGLPLFFTLFESFRLSALKAL